MAKAFEINRGIWATWLLIQPLHTLLIIPHETWKSKVAFGCNNARRSAMPGLAQPPEVSLIIPDEAGLCQASDEWREPLEYVISYE